MDSLRVSGKLKMALVENAPNYRNFILLHVIAEIKTDSTQFGVADKYATKP